MVGLQRNCLNTVSKSSVLTLKTLSTPRRGTGPQEYSVKLPSEDLPAIHLQKFAMLDTEAKDISGSSLPASGIDNLMLTDS